MIISVMLPNGILISKAYPEYNVVPYQTAQASAAVLVFKDAFERANSFDRDKVRDALAATDMETFYGDISLRLRVITLLSQCSIVRSNLMRLTSQSSRTKT